MTIEEAESAKVILHIDTILVVLDPCKLQMTHSRHPSKVIRASQDLAGENSSIDMQPGDVLIMLSGEFVVSVDVSPFAH